jgi:hypothetical protein
VVLGVSLGRFPGVMLGMQRMAVRCMGMLCRVIVCAFAVVFRREAMMRGGVLVMVGRLFVVFRDFRCV